MNKKIIILSLFICLSASLLWGQNNNIVILYDNDVHGAVEGYPAMASLRDSIRSITPYVSVVSMGDFLSGTSIGSASKGKFIVRLMNATGYDFVTLGNHEFDYGIPILNASVKALNANVLCSNFATIADSSQCFPAYQIRNYGKTKIAFVGLSTPHTASTSTPQFFQDSIGHWLYTFFPNKIDSVLQHAVNAARRDGADYVVLLAHVGETNTPGLIAATSGIDVVLDGHSHSVIPHTILHNKEGREVLWTSTGTRFEYVGQLTISPNGKMDSRLIPTQEISITAQDVADTLQTILQEYSSIGGREVGYSDIRLLRKSQDNEFVDSPMGNFFSDAYRMLTHADIGIVNAGGMRKDIEKGIIHFDDLYSAAPFDNKVCVVEMDGQSLLDALEMSCRKGHKKGGGLLYVSGLHFDIDTTIASTVKVDANNIFLRVEGARRVCHVEVWDSESQTYQPLDPKRTYRVAGSDYVLLKNGDGVVFAHTKIVEDNICTYVQALERYLTEILNNRISPIYEAPQGRIRAIGSTPQK